MHSSVSIPIKLIHRYTGATDVQITEHQGYWAYRIETSKSYDELSDTLIAIEIHIKTRCFIPILDDNGSTNGKISFNPPENKGPSNLLIPGMKRLSKELEVDFKASVYGSEGKRKREQKKTIYENPKRMEGKHIKRQDPRLLEAVNVLHAKDETIKALTNALVSKEELVRTQAALICALQK